MLPSLPQLDVRALEYIIKKRMKSDPTFKDYDFEGSGLSSIIRLLALDSNNLAFLNNMQFGESNLLTAQQRTNAALAAQYLSYVPKNKCCSTVVARIEVEPYENHSIPTELVLDKKASFVGFKDNKPFNFCVGEPISAPYNKELNKFVFENVVLLQGEWNSKSYVVEGSAVSKYKIPDKDVDINHLLVQVQDDLTSGGFITYDRYKTPFDLDQFAFLYYVDLAIDGFYGIEFGDGFVSRKVEDQKRVYISYLSTQGADANGVSKINPASSIGGFGRIEVSIDKPASGGKDEETLEEIKFLAPLGFQAEGTAVGASNYESLTRSLFTNVVDARAYGGETLPLPAAGFVYISVVTQDGLPLTDSERASMTETISRYNVGPVSVKFVDAELVYINISADVYWNPTLTQLSEEDLKTHLKNNIIKWGEKNFHGFSSLFDKQMLESDIAKMERSVISDIVLARYSTKLKPEVGVQNYYNINFGRTLAEGSLLITDYRPVPADIESKYLVRDIAGTVKLFRITEGKTFFVKDVGTIDYKNGVVDLYDVTVSRTPDDGYMLFVSPDGVNQNLTPMPKQILKIGNIDIRTEVRYDNK